MTTLPEERPLPPWMPGIWGQSRFSPQNDSDLGYTLGSLRYPCSMGRLILKHQGTLERFTGDGMMVFFTGPATVTSLAARLCSEAKGN